MNLKDQREAALKAARDIAEQAKAADRNMTGDEIATFDQHLAKADQLAAELKAETESRSRFEKISAFGPVTPEPAPGVESDAKSLGELFAKAAGEDGLHMLKQRPGYSIGTPEMKANTDQHVTSDYPAALLTDVDRTVVRGYRRAPVVADLLGSGTLSGNAVTYFVEAAIEGAFTTVGETGQKPQLHNLPPTPVTDALKKIAGWWDMSDEMVEDLPFMVSEINGRGLYLLSMAEEAQLLNGGGQGTDLLGLLNRPLIQTETQGASPDTSADTIFRAITKVQTATGLSADGIVINPADYQSLRLAKDGNNQYYGGGFFAGQYGSGGIVEQPPLWGLRTIVTAAIGAGTALVGAFQAGATVYRKGGVRVESTNSDLGKFTTNVITTRIEERVALAVRIPTAFVKVTLAGGASPTSP